MPSKFTHLHVHSQYSLLDGLPKIPDLLNYAKELGMYNRGLTSVVFISKAFFLR